MSFKRRRDQFWTHNVLTILFRRKVVTSKQRRFEVENNFMIMLFRHRANVETITSQRRRNSNATVLHIDQIVDKSMQNET